MIRSHSSLEGTFMDDDDDNDKERAGYGGGGTRRDSPKKKNWRLSDDDDDEESDISEVSVTTANNGGRSRRKRRRLRRVAAVTYDSCSVSESEKEDGALSLMMLSRDHYYCSIEIGVSEEEIKKKKTYECATCGRAFGSYQALGGHRTSHRNDVDVVELAAAAAKGAGARASGSVYECLVCHKVFPSGQALGGHKRRHARA